MQRLILHQFEFCWINQIITSIHLIQSLSKKLIWSLS